jgi:hypothetical protein
MPKRQAVEDLEHESKMVKVEAISFLLLPQEIFVRIGAFLELRDLQSPKFQQLFEDEVLLKDTMDAEKFCTETSMELDQVLEGK